ncbi:hypothetical protein MBVR141_0207 [Mycoplasmopsis bovirhinis]|uniref:hypothetical protein n=1 Tax=Mycoplasmopsis bovirhinis TaxID=29553 RepID=UPI000BB9F985|nr:hypothetical protein [Mycoplasmopsis bovirhinis]BBA22172.1 hypothetical protein MBVR141_0207 [Mycoplasmopsis bovirhinis]
MIENYQNQVKEILKVGDFLITKSSISEPLTKYADIYLGSTPSRSKPEFWNGNIKWINSGALTDKPAVTEPTEHITSLGIKTSATKPGNKGNTVLSIIEPNINKIAVLLDNNIYFNQSIICLAAKESKHHGLIYFASRKLIYKIKRYATGAAQQSLNKQMFEESKIYVTNKIIIKQLNLLLNKLLKLEEKIRILKQIKQQLLNKYF